MNNEVPLVLNELEGKRLTICRKCEYFVKNNRCGYLIEKTKRIGNLYHPSGICNVSARCPLERLSDSVITKWNSIPSSHAYLLHTTMAPLTKHEIHHISKVGIRSYGIFRLMSDLFNRQDRIYQSSKRSEWLNELERLSKLDNNYNYISKVEVDLVTGRIYS